MHFGQTPHAAGHIVLSDGLRPTWAGLRIRSGSASYKDLVLAYAYVSTHWNGEIVSVDAAIAYSPNGFSAAGSYWQNLKNNQYRIWAEGTIDPTVLNPIIDQGWWTHLWSEFEFKPAHWPWASFSMIGTHNMGTVGKKIYVQAKIDDFGYREIDITSAQGLLYMNGDRVDLYDFSIDTPDGDASLHLQWQWDGPVRHYLAFEASSTLPLADGGMLVGKETAATLSEFKSSLPPRIALVGVLTGDSAADIAEETYVKLDIDFPGTFTYDWLFMDTLSGEITITPKTRELPNLKGVLAGGPVTGSVHIDVLPESALAFKATLDIQDAQLNQLGNALAFLQGPAPELIPFAAPEQPAPTEADFAAIAGAQGPDPQAIAAVAAAGNPQPAQNAQAAASDSSDTANLNVLNLPGLVDFKGTISGISSNLHTFNGEGNLSIEAADLAQINLFGGLSGLFRYLGIPIGTLVFNKATTNWDLVNGIVHMPDVRISGNTGLITASGNIDIQDSSINFLLYLQPMGEITTPIISQALSLFSPLANLLSVRISGTLVEPSFKTNVHPVGIFSGRSTVEPHDMVVPTVRPPLKNSGPRKIRRPQHH